jgi:hypothetical protein
MVSYTKEKIVLMTIKMTQVVAGCFLALGKLTGVAALGIGWIGYFWLAVFLFILAFSCIAISVGVCIKLMRIQASIPITKEERICTTYSH